MAMVEGATLSDPERALLVSPDRLPAHHRPGPYKGAPNILCAFAFELAQSFSRFYAAHHILSEENEALRANRLATCRLALRELETLLDLRHQVPERMSRPRSGRERAAPKSNASFSAPKPQIYPTRRVDLDPHLATIPPTLPKPAVKALSGVAIHSTPAEESGHAG